MGSCTDITDEQQTQEKLETIIGSITDGLAVLDRDYQFVYCNARGAEMVGMRPRAAGGAERVGDGFPREKTPGSSRSSS
ncbi:MAG: PAS domain-containing protein [Armatimonas sp.]